MTRILIYGIICCITGILVGGRSGYEFGVMEQSALSEKQFHKVAIDLNCALYNPKTGEFTFVKNEFADDIHIMKEMEKQAAGDVSNKAVEPPPKAKCDSSNGCTLTSVKNHAGH